MAHRSHRLLGIAVCVAVVVGWLVWSSGGPTRLSHADVRRSIATIESLRAEARHLDRIIADEHDLPRTTSVRAEELATALDDESAVLATARMPRGDEHAAKRAVAAAAATVDHLEELVVDPTGGGA